MAVVGGKENRQVIRLNHEQAIVSTALGDAKLRRIQRLTGKHFKLFDPEAALAEVVTSGSSLPPIEPWPDLSPAIEADARLYLSGEISLEQYRVAEENAFPELYNNR